MITRTNYTFDPRPFTYDSNIIPASPVGSGGIPYVGDTWRERDSSNRIVDEWEWSGAVWYSREVITESYSQTPITGIRSGPTYGSIYNTYLIDFVVSSKIFSGAAHDNSNFYTFALQLLSQAQGQFGIADNFLMGYTIGIPDNTPFAFSINVNTAYYVPTQVTILTDITGSPSTIPGLTGTYRYRKIRT